MDPALKKRMIGAAILIVLAIIFVPMLFTGRQGERTETVDLNLPKTPDRDFTTRTIPLDTAPKPAPAEGSDTLPTVDTTKGPGKPVTVEPSPEPAAAPKADTPVASASKPVPAAQPAPVAPKPEEMSEGTSEHGRWAVSYGTYGKVENADKLIADLKKAGIAAYGDPVAVKDGNGVRVRSGPYLDKSQAEKARLSARAVRSDAPGKLIELDDTTPHETPGAAPPKAAAGVPAPAPAATQAPAAAPAARATAPAAPAAASAAPAPTTVTGWAVQVGAYQSDHDAQGRRDALRNAGFSAYVEPVKTQKGTLYRVRVGPAAERAGADKLRAELKEKMKLDGTVVQEP
jgi:DedD protein